MDVHIPRSVTDALLRHGVDLMTSQEDGTATFSDGQLLDRSTALERVLVTQDADLLALANERQQINKPFSGVIYSHQLRSSIGELVRDLELLAKCGAEDDFRNAVVYLPL
jgi:predicted nuclease of predicted toxin-antitoxin system